TMSRLLEKSGGAAPAFPGGGRPRGAPFRRPIDSGTGRLGLPDDGDLRGETQRPTKPGAPSGGREQPFAVAGKGPGNGGGRAAGPWGARPLTDACDARRRNVPRG